MQLEFSCFFLSFIPVPGTIVEDHFAVFAGMAVIACGTIALFRISGFGIVQQSLDAAPHQAADVYSWRPGHRSFTSS